MALNEQDRATIQQALTKINNAIEAARLQLDQIKEAAISILRDLQD